MQSIRFGAMKIIEML